MVLVDLGQTADPQAELNEDLRTRVVSLWQHVVSAAGATCSQSLAAATTRTATDTAGIAVTPVPLPTEPVYKPCGSTTLSDSGPVGFVGDEAVFRNAGAARSALKPLAEEAVRDKKAVTLVGTTASAHQELCDQLSKDRAEAVKAIWWPRVDADRSPRSARATSPSTRS